MTHGDGERETFARFSPLHPNTEEAPGEGTDGKGRESYSDVQTDLMEVA